MNWLFLYVQTFKFMAAEIKLGTATVKVGEVKYLFDFRTFTGGGLDLCYVTPNRQQLLVESSPGAELAFRLRDGELAEEDKKK